MISYIYILPGFIYYPVVETGRAPSHPLKTVIKNTISRWETGHAPSLQLDMLAIC